MGREKTQTSSASVGDECIWQMRVVGTERPLEHLQAVAGLTQSSARWR